MTLRVIHIGLGERGRHWLEYVYAHPDFDGIAGVDSAPAAIDRARGLPGQDHGRFFTDLGQALSEVEADAALITSPSFLHPAHARAALDAGLGVLVEKPLGSDVAEAADLVAHARALGRPLMVAENYRFFQAERTLRRQLADGAIGEIRAVVCIDRRDQPSSTQGPWVKAMPEPFLNEIAVHHFDSFRYLFARQPVSLLATSYNPPGSDYDSGAAVDALIELADGLHIHYGGTMAATRYEFSLLVEGSRGDLWTDRRRVRHRAAGKRFFRQLPAVPVPPGDEARYPKAGTVSLLNQFRDALQGSDTAETAGADNIWTLAMVEAAKRSVGSGRRVAIAEVFPPELQRRAGARA
jgi:predicted dehydrogenase